MGDDLILGFLYFVMVYCFVQAIFGRQINRLGTWIAMIGAPKKDACYRPSKYVEGNWRNFERPLYRQTTEGSAKWQTGQHNAGCVWHAPDGECICDEFQK